MGGNAGIESSSEAPEAPLTPQLKTRPVQRVLALHMPCQSRDLYSRVMPDEPGSTHRIGALLGRNLSPGLGGFPGSNH